MGGVACGSTTCSVFYGQCYEDCPDPPTPTPTPQPFSCDQLTVTDLHQDTAYANSAAATITNDSSYDVYIVNTWFSWYDGVDDVSLSGYVDWFRQGSTNYWGGENQELPNSYDDPTEVATDANETTRIGAQSSTNWLVDIDGGTSNSLGYGRTDVCLSFTAYDTDRGDITCYNKCTGYDGQPLTYCGDNIVQDPNSYGESEQCDAGTENSATGACNTSCRLTHCGDGYVQAPNGDGLSE